MEGIPHTYLGRQISTEHFRAFIYDARKQKKLVNSWEEFERHMQTGIWFASLDDIKPVTPEIVRIEHKKRGK